MHAAIVSLGAANVVSAAIPCVGVGLTFCPAQLVIAIASELVAIANMDLFIDQVNNNLGVSFSSGSADYAEYLEREDPLETFFSGQIVGVKGGKITKNLGSASQLFVISTSPVVLGNMPRLDEEWKYEKVAFMGQVPTMVRGKVNSGDFIIPSGLNDGTGIGVSPDKVKPEEYSKIVGVSWSDAISLGEVTFVNMSIGLNNNDLAKLAVSQEKRMNEFEARILALENGEKYVTKDTRVDTEYSDTGENITKESISQTNNLIIKEDDEWPQTLTEDMFNKALEYIKDAYKANGMNINEHAGFRKWLNDVDFKNQQFQKINDMYTNNREIFIDKYGG